MEFRMQVSKWGNSLAIRLPKTVVEGLDLKVGDQVDVQIAGERKFDIEKSPSRRDLIERLRKYRGRMPADFKFDRLEANDGRG
jgi:antitoxin MazE